MLEHSLHPALREAGLDEAGRGCLAGPVVAAAVILPSGFSHPVLNDSKKLSEAKRNQLRLEIEQHALAYAVAFVDHQRIDEINILNASIEAMHIAVSNLKLNPQFLLVDGNKFKPYPDIAHQCVVKGDGKYANIAAASILAKTYRDEFMDDLHSRFPQYDWLNNKGYPTPKHIQGIKDYGMTDYHRRSFHLKSMQMELF